MADASTRGRCWRSQRQRCSTRAHIPEASVAVVLSGSGSTREHIQRLGRILRKQPSKEAILYEVVTMDTTEEQISRRRSDAGQFREAETTPGRRFEMMGVRNADG